MKTTKQNITNIILFLVVLLASQSALAFYDPSTGRWLSRDPIGEPGFQALQRVRASFADRKCHVCVKALD